MLPNIISIILYIMDLVDLKSELSKRLKYGDEKKEAEYQSKIKEINNNYPDEVWRIPESYRNEISELKICAAFSPHPSATMD